MKLELHNFPRKDGVYFAANHNTVRNRLEVEKVTYREGRVWLEGEEGWYIREDFDYWSDQLADV